ncbi:3-methyl-2-oxobutanoate hydroxymethyltransferase [Acidithiobacillus sp. IBUN Pt1247-S3]|uniref:3-methyl-2-oxobutanoate hydroxymethyltransferase n=1 Tax=Acidithiobacillus sp. IBUN Pt1247-S3 TaxID=3166642 RepID=UPI0034E5794D
MSKRIDTWNTAKQRGEKRVLVTAYDYPFARLAEEAGVDGVLVGDSLGMVVQGHRDTLQVSLEQMAYHTEMVARACTQSLVFADLPLGTYEESPAQCWRSATTLLRAGAEVIKWEGGLEFKEHLEFCAARGLNVCVHLGLTPQRLRQWGSFQRQGATPETAERLVQEALALAQSGARFLLLEAVPADLAARITQQSAIPVIGIGAGPDTDAQVLVMHDVLGLGKAPPFARAFVDGAALLRSGLADYTQAVRDQSFPATSRKR